LKQILDALLSEELTRMTGTIQGRFFDKLRIEMTKSVKKTCTTTFKKALEDKNN